MRRTYFLFLLTALLVAAPRVDAAAILIGVFDGNVNESAASVDEIRALAADLSITLYSKSDNNSPGDPFPANLMTITGTPGTSGTWATVDTGVLISYFAVKASSQFALYQVVPPANAGSWNTSDIPFNVNPHAVSHLTFYLADISSDPTVPEPSTFGMLGGGGLAALWFGRRRGRKNAA